MKKTLMNVKIEVLKSFGITTTVDINTHVEYVAVDPNTLECTNYDDLRSWLDLLKGDMK